MKARTENLVFVIENNHFREDKIHENFVHDHDHVFEYFASSSACLAQMHRHPMAVLIDYELKTFNHLESDALKILSTIKENKHHTQVVFFAGKDSLEVSKDVIAHGAYDYVVVGGTQYLRLRKVLENIERLRKHVLSEKKARLMTWIIFALYTGVIIGISIIYLKGYLHAGGGELIMP